MTEELWLKWSEQSGLLLPYAHPLANNKWIERFQMNYKSFALLSKDLPVQEKIASGQKAEKYKEQKSAKSRKYKAERTVKLTLRASEF